MQSIDEGQEVGVNEEINLHDGKGTWEIKITELELGAVDPPQDFGSANTSCNTFKTTIYQSHQAVVMWSGICHWKKEPLYAPARFCAIWAH
jgi:hypothetical protein